MAPLMLGKRAQCRAESKKIVVIDTACDLFAAASQTDGLQAISLMFIDQLVDHLVEVIAEQQPAAQGGQEAVFFFSQHGRIILPQKGGDSRRQGPDHRRGHIRQGIEDGAESGQVQSLPGQHFKRRYRLAIVLQGD